MGNLIGGGVWKQVMIVAVLGGTLASLQAAIVSAGRISFAMGRDGVFPRWSGQVSERHQTPWNATSLFGLLNVALLWAATLIGPIGTAFMAFVIVCTLAQGLLNGVEIGAGFGLAALGLVLSFAAQRAGRSPFYSAPAGPPETNP